MNSSSDRHSLPGAPPGDLQALDAWLAAHEASFGDLRPAAHRRVRWRAQRQGERRERRPLSLAFLHGFSASAPELSPLPERLADTLDAHLYYARLTGHGLPGAQMASGSIANWLRDARQTLDIAARLGERVVLLGSSTGAALAAWLAVDEARAGRDRLAAILLLSPNFALADPRSGALLLPGAAHIARALIGTTRNLDPINALHAEHWTTTYPSSVLVPMARMVRRVRRLPLHLARAPALVLYDEDDKVVSAAATRTAMARYGGQPCELQALEAHDDPNRHTLAGDALGPALTAPVAALCEEFLARVLAPEVADALPDVLTDTSA